MKELPVISKYRGSNRVLLLFAPERNHPSYVEATRSLTDQLERVREKDVTVLSVFSSGRLYENRERIEGADVNALRRHFRAQRNDFTAVLLDEEGQEVLRQSKQLDLPGVLGQIRPSRAVPEQPRRATRH